MDDVAPLRSAPSLDLLTRAATLPGFTKAGALTPEARTFLDQVRDHATAEELWTLGDDLIATLHDFWLWTAEKPPLEQRVRLLSRPEGDVLEIAGPDMPFLVRSVMGEITERGLVVRALFHPIVSVSRDAAGVRSNGESLRESYIQVLLEPLGPERGAALLGAVERALRDVRLAVADYASLRARMAGAAAMLENAPIDAPADEIAEAVAFLRWLEQDNFTFLGARDYDFRRTAAGDFVTDEPIIVPDSSLGVLRDADRYVLRRGDEPSKLTPELRRFIDEPAPLIVSKSNFKSLVHRRATADFIGVKRYGADGAPVGETRFVGLFTADAYNRATDDIPLLRRKVARVLAASGATPGTHDYSVLRNILETYPRDELFQISELELLDIGLGILHLSDRPRPRVFVRRDRFNRFLSALVFVPKERFNSTLRKAIGEALVEAYGGQVEAFYPTLDENPLARIHFLIQNIDRNRPEPDAAALNARIAALTRTWNDSFIEALRADDALADHDAIAARYADAFTAGYRERFSAVEALIDIGQMEALREAVRVRAYRLAGDGPEKLRCKLYSRAEKLSLSAIMPVLENMGLYVESEDDLQVSPAGAAEPFFVHDLDMRTADGAPLDFSAVENSFEDAFAAAWEGRAENDAFNRLILKLGISWREAALIRALARYRTQTGLDPSQPVQEAALAAHPDIAAMILELFRIRFDPALKDTRDQRAARAASLGKQIDDALGAVASLDDDRVLRRIARLVEAILRTNFYQPGDGGAPKPYMSFKIASPAVLDLPLPKPYREIWVWSAQVEGVHLRFGPIARGGLRWSDRRDDFRTEILSLAKAQQVKNAIIVPVGAKGGFFPKQLPRGGKPPEIRAAGIEAYKTFLRGLLDITDDIDGASVVHPDHVICWDDDDPYLVVAADKGTATFSDIANGISAEYGFWLGDAFASGGSAGYDHKAMGITARGAWEAVKRHFREIGTDIQTTPFNVIGVGDMSGDVFGNGMLLSEKIRLVAAFDHRDIFVDPTPDPETAHAERARLFALPTSSWKDYDASLISTGGGVFSRAAKSISLTAEMKAISGIEQDTVTPAEFINALLRAPADLLWFGGIGTFIKAAAESHADVGDKANDLTRVDAEDVKARVIGEGANLGVTQAGRIAFARRGGRINSDAIDNSAGVDTSDHEVNIKILLTDAERAGDLKPADRNPLLAAMTDEVSAHVLRHNYNQTLALSLAESAARADLDAHERVILRLEREGKLNRRVEGLPTAEQFADLRQKGLGLTRPELAKLIAYAKLDLSAALRAGPALDDPVFEGDLINYFPSALERFPDAIASHRLRRDIIATTIADDIVNITGPTFIDRVREAAQTDSGQAASAFYAAQVLHQTNALAARVNALDNKIPAAAQLALHQEIAAALRRATIALVNRLAREPALGVGALVRRYMGALRAQREALWSSLTPVERTEAEERTGAFTTLGAPTELARDVAALVPLTPAFDIADLAAARSLRPEAAAALYRAVGAAFSLDRLRAGAHGLRLGQHWERLALRRLLGELNNDQRDLAIAAAGASGPDAAAIVQNWITSLNGAAAPAADAISAMQDAGAWSFAKIVLAAAALRALTMALAQASNRNV